MKELSEVCVTSVGQFGCVDTKTRPARRRRMEDNRRIARGYGAFEAVVAGKLDLGDEVERGGHRKRMVLVGEDKENTARIMQLDGHPSDVGR